MRTGKPLLRGAGLLIAILLAACSGGNVEVSFENSGFPFLPPMPASETIIVHGEVNGFGSVTVNDVSFQTGSAAITVNGQPGTISDLRQGQLVTVRGRINADNRTGTANSIRFDANVIGAVESIDAPNQRLIVMGQPVSSDSTTRFGAGIDPSTYVGLNVGSIAEISGYALGDGTIRATRIDLAAAGAGSQVIGPVLQLDTANLLFRINRLLVDYGSALLIDLPGGAPANAMRVNATGSLQGGVFKVERLVGAPVLGGLNGQRVQVAGIVTRYDSPSDFGINGWPAGVEAGTEYRSGDAGDLQLNTELVLEGHFAAGGRMLAERITLGHVASEPARLVYDFRDFTEISVPTVFNVDLTYGPEFSVEIFVDRGYEHRIDVTQSGTRLNIALSPGDGNIASLNALIVMPVLNTIDLSGVVNAVLHDFNQSQMTINVGGVSHLRGDAMAIHNLATKVSGVSRLDLGGIRPIGSANIDVSGVSQAILNMDVGSTLTGSVSSGQGTGVSTLFYYGTNADISVTTDSNSSIVRLGDTRP